MLFALIPLFLIVGSSAYLFNQRIQSELKKRLIAFEQGIELELNDIEEKLRFASFNHARDTELLRLFQTRRIPQLERFSKRIIENFISDRISFYFQNGEHVLSATATRVTENPQMVLPEEGDLLSKDLILDIQEQKQLLQKTTRPDIGLVLESYTQLQSQNLPVGILKETIVIDRGYLLQTKERTGLHIGIFDSERKLVTSTFAPRLEKSLFRLPRPQDGFISRTMGTQDYLVLMHLLKDDEEHIAAYVAAFTSKANTQAALREIRNIFIFISALIIVGTFLFTQLAVRIVLGPLDKVRAASTEIAKGKLGHVVSVTSLEELSELIDAFNHMSKALKKTTQERELAQTQLFHSSRMVALGQLVAGVAHELNNPIGYTHSNITHLQTYIQKMKTMLSSYQHQCFKLPKKIQASLKETYDKLEMTYVLKDIDPLIQSSLDGAERTKDIVLGLRNFSRMDEAEIKAVDIHEGLDNTLRLLGSELKDKIQVHKKYGKLALFTCYPSQLNQVFMNLLTNAIHAISATGDIWITTHQSKKDIEIEIRDNGCGISPKNIDHVFDPFFTTKEIGKGTGLGLAISYGIIEKHRGKISVQSKQGVGTTFTLHLPRDHFPLKKD